MKKHSIFLFLLSAMLLFSINLQSQNTKTITGKVTDEKGEGIIGANVIVKGTGTGTITDVNGMFSLQVPNNAILVISYLGYDTKEILVGDKNSYNVQLSESSKYLEEVVVVGYGTVNKRSFTGSVASVKSEELTSLKTLSPSAGL